MSRSKRALQWVFPPRASTQTWMFLTFALFVGLAVAGVGLYVVFMLRVQIEEAMQRSLIEQAERVAIVIEQQDDVSEWQQVITDIGRLTNLHITLIDPAQMQAARAADETATLIDRPEGEALIQEFEDTEGQPHVAVMLHRPGTGLAMRTEQPEPLLFTLVRSMEWTLILGMIMALLMALVGSWIAADRVTRPLQAIRNSARHISQGKPNENIRVDTRSAEIQDLAKNLNRMSDSFREKIDELERLTHLQSEFIGNVSHEVRNPIFAISGYLEALGSPRLPDTQRRRYAEKGLLNLQRLSNLFNDLIEIARLEYREDLIKPSVFDLAELIEEVAEMLRPKAEEKGLHLLVENPHLLVQADRNRIRQVLTNLIDNAIAYSDEGTVRCRFNRRLDKVRVEVVDTGKGIPENHLDRIFERFYRVDPDRSRKSGGTGLGLSIVKQILQAHGEVIHVESTVGRGTRFWFDLPYAEQPTEIEEVA